jgi:hypothetical protein
MAANSRTGGAAAPDISTLTASFVDAFAQADAAAAARVQHAQSVYLARASQLSRTAVALRAQYGGDDAGVKRAEASVAAARAAGSQMAMLYQRLTIPEPSVAPEGWVLHGRVFRDASKPDEALQPAAGYTVFFADAAKAYQQAYGFSSTDDTGYFLLRYDGTRAASADKAATAGKKARASELFVEVTDPRGRVAYMSDATFQPVIGAAVYEEIVVPDNASAKGQPPGQVRKVGMPKREPKR